MAQSVQKDLAANVTYLRGQLHSLEYVLSEYMQASASGDAESQQELVMEADDQIADLDTFWRTFMDFAEAIISKGNASTLADLEEKLGKMRVGEQ